MSPSPDRLAALMELHQHPQWPHRACARTSELGEPLVDPDLFYAVTSQEQAAAVQVCEESCPVLAACRAYALGSDGWWEPDGVWGGLTVKERMAIRKERKATRRAELKRRSRQARQPRPVAVQTWRPTTKQLSLLRVLAQKDADLHTAAEALGSTYASVRWIHARMCRDLGFYPDELTVGQLVAAARSKVGDSGSSGQMVDAA
ncbi:WhiB family transcriptional regulator [Streptomyces sp. CC224B]|uniref:WhiB family transcriptional regulator n=1 Tax=Streptomyces sp. CC224B TaxID=3044571 RepID=UPI0024A7C5CC|nr:WhiB family transcriptional regulator [Streptomyces sp. CC224B]